MNDYKKLLIKLILDIDISMFDEACDVLGMPTNYEYLDKFLLDWTVGDLMSVYAEMINQIGEQDYDADINLVYKGGKIE